jgi:hypothetical protein
MAAPKAPAVIPFPSITLNRLITAVAKANTKLHVYFMAHGVKNAPLDYFTLVEKKEVWRKVEL